MLDTPRRIDKVHQAMFLASPFDSDRLEVYSTPLEIDLVLEGGI